MTLRTRNQTDSVSVESGNGAPQLPAYSESDGHSNAGFEMVSAPHSPPEPVHMTAEQEKAYLAAQDQAEAQNERQPPVPVQPAGEWRGQYGSTLLAPSGVDEQGHSTRGLQIPSCRRKVSSGFPYPDMLSTYGIGPQEWSVFTSEITTAARMTDKDWVVTVGAGVATFCVSGIFIGWFGMIPAIAVGHNLRRSTEYNNLRAARDTGDLEAKLLRWNQTTFAPKGFLVRLDLPGDEPSDLDRMDVFSKPKKWGWKCCGGGRRARAGGSCGTEDRMAPAGSDKRSRCSRKKTANRGRIMIVPLNGANNITTQPSAKKGEETTGHVAVPMSEKDQYISSPQEV